MTRQLLQSSALAGVLMFGLGLPALAQDAGTLDKEKAEAAHKRRADLLAICGPRLPDAAVLRRHASAHLVFHGCRRLRRPARARATPTASPGASRSPRSTGQPVKLSRPLDFLVVADHSDNMGFFPDLFAGKPDLLADPTGRKWYDMIQSGKGADAAIEIIVAFSHGTFPKDLMYFPGTRAYQQRVAGDDRRGGALQRAGPLHRLHRLRMDLEHRRQQPASQCHLPRQCRQGEPGRAVHRLSALRQRQPGRAVEMDGRLREEDRRQRAGHRA